MRMSQTDKRKRVSNLYSLGFEKVSNEQVVSARAVGRVDRNSIAIIRSSITFSLVRRAVCSIPKCHFETLNHLLANECHVSLLNGLRSAVSAAPSTHYSISIANGRGSPRLR